MHSSLIDLALAIILSLYIKLDLTYIQPHINLDDVLNKICESPSDHGISFPL